MKIFSKFFSKEVFEQKSKEIQHLDFSLFVDDIPTQDDLSEINIMVLEEPNEYFGLNNWAIENKHLFSAILTWDDRVLNSCDNALFLPFGHTWFKPYQYEKTHEKKFEIAHLCGILNKTYGHNIRHELMARKEEIKIPINFHKTIGDRYNIEDARIGKETVFGNSMFGIAIENFSHRGYFSEKILDCFLMKTVPIYWGCSNINEFFNQDGIIQIDNVDDIINHSKKMTKWWYNSYERAIDDNYQRALKYVDYEQNIIDKVEEIFKHNKMI